MALGSPLTLVRPSILPTVRLTDQLSTQRRATHSYNNLFIHGAQCQDSKDRYPAGLQQRLRPCVYVWTTLTLSKAQIPNSSCTLTCLAKLALLDAFQDEVMRFEAVRSIGACKHCETLLKPGKNPATRVF